MANSILFIATLIVVSGLIAFLGDWLGRRMGKRRLTLFGMRPRNTAIVVTTITGMLIAGLTIATLLVVSSDLREAIIRGKRLVTENRDYQARNRKLHARNLQLAAASEKLTDEVKRISAQAEDAALALDKARFRVQSLETDIKARQAELVALRTTGRATAERLRSISATLEDRKEDLSRAKAELAARSNDLAAKRKELARKTAELADKMKQLRDAEQSIRLAEDEIKRDEQLIREQREQLARGVQVTKMLLRGEVVLQQGQEIGRKVIDGTLPPDQIRSELTALLDSASERARRMEAGPSDGGRAIQLVFFDRPTENLIADENACIEKAVQAIAEQGHSRPGSGVLACLTVVTNTLKGQRAPAELTLFWNKLAFRRGDNIARRTVDGRLSEGRILLAVMDFLRENVRSQAQEAGVVPVASPDPEKTAEQISDEQLDQVMELVGKIRSIGKRVELRAIARKDIYAAGPLDLGNIGFAISTLTTAEK